MPVHITTPACMRVNCRFCWPYMVFHQFCNEFTWLNYGFQDTVLTLRVKRGFFVHVVSMENCIMTFVSTRCWLLGDLKPYMNAEKKFFKYCWFSAALAVKIETAIFCFEMLIPIIVTQPAAKVINASLFQSYQLVSFHSCVKKSRFN